MKVLVYEQWLGGHYFNYLECLVPKLASRVDRVVLHMTDRASRASDFEVKLGSLRSIPNVELITGLPEISLRLSPRDRMQASINLLRSIKSIRPDYTLVPSADAQAMALAAPTYLGIDPLRGLAPIEGTFHTGYGSVSHWKHWAKEAMYSAVYRRIGFSAINFVNARYYEFIRSKGFRSSRRMRLVGDPVPQVPRIGRAAARRMLGVEQEGRYIGLIGSLDKRKAIPELLAAFRSARLAHTDRLLLAGRLARPFAALIETSYSDLIEAGRLVVLNRFLSDEELAHGYEALDVAAVVYYDFPGLASLALKAVAAGTPVLAHDFGWLGMLLRRFGNGVLVDMYDQRAFGEAITVALDKSLTYADSEPIQRLLAFHSPDNFAENMLANITAMAGRTRGTPERTWDWVLASLPPDRRHR